LPARPAAASDVAAAIGDHGIQVLHVCTPLDSHDAIVSEGLGSGAHVLVEKPLAADAPAAERLHALATSRGRLLCPVHQFLFQPGVLSAQRALAALGPVRQLDVVACSAGADGTGEALREEVALDILPHGLALAARLLGGRMAEASWRVSAGPPGELRAMADLGGASVMLAVSMRARPTENSLTVRCDGGTVRANLYHGYATIERGAPSRVDKVGRPFVASTLTLGAALSNLGRRLARGESAYPGLRELVRRFHLACAGQGSSPVTVDESLDVARARDTIASLRRRVTG